MALCHEPTEIWCNRRMHETSSRHGVILGSHRASGFVHLSGKILPCAQNRNVFFGKSAGILPVFFILFIAQSQKGLKNNGMTQSLQNPGVVLKRQNSSGLFYSKTGPNTAQNLSVFCLRNLLAVMKPFYPCYNT